jgi:hypothetical protein
VHSTRLPSPSPLPRFALAGSVRFDSIMCAEKGRGCGLFLFIFSLYFLLMLLLLLDWTNSD